MRDLAAEVHRTRTEFDRAYVAWRDAARARDQLVAAMLATHVFDVQVPAKESSVERAADVSRVDAPIGAALPDASPRTVQNLLFVLGGVLLGIGAIVFTAVAWATYGVPGRAAVLAGATVIAFVAPVIAARRGLRATAETVAAVGLLLVALDGYGLWTLHAFGAGTSLRASTFAGVVAACISLIAWTYGRALRLVGTRFVALIAVQPVLPLAMAGHATTHTTVSWCFAGVAAADVAVVAWRSRIPATNGVGVVETVLAWVFVAGALALATGHAFAAMFGSGGTAVVAPASGALVAAAVILGWAGRVVRDPVVRSLIVAAAVLLAGGAIIRLLVVATPVYPLVVASALVLAMVAAAALAAPRQPTIVGTWAADGVMLAARTATAGLGVVTVASLGDVVVRRAAAVAAGPWWHTDLGAVTSPAALAGLPVAIVVIAVGGAVIANPGVPASAWRHRVALGAVPPLTLAVGTVAGVPRQAMLVADGLAFVALLAVAVVALRRGREALACIAVADIATLAVHAAWFGLARATTTALVLGAIGAPAVVFALTIRTVERTTRSTARVVRGVAVAIGLAALPGFAASLSATAGAAAITDLRIAGVAIVASVVALTAVRRRQVRAYAVVAVTAAATAVGFAALPVASVDAIPLYVIGAMLAAVLAPAAADLRGPRAFAMASSAALLAPVAIAGLVPVISATYVEPYGWLAYVWRGVPRGSGVAPWPSAIDGTDLVATLLAAAVAIVAGWIVNERRTALRCGWHSVAIVGVAVLTVAHVPWPAAAVVLLVVGLVDVLHAAATPVNRGWDTGLFGFVLAGGGVVALTATRPSTLCALGALVVVATVVGAAGRTMPRRVAGWIAAVTAADTFAIVSMLASGTNVGVAAYAILAVAALALFVTAVVPPRAERRAAPSERATISRLLSKLGDRGWETPALTAAAHASAAIAFGLSGTLERAAIIAAIWGALVGTRTLLPDWSINARRTSLCAAVALEVVAWWLLAAGHGVRAVEAYTLPFAGVAVLSGWYATRSRHIGSWSAYSPGLLSGLLPSLAMALAFDASPVRRLGVGAAALAIVMLGARHRLQAPVVIAGGTVIVLALHEIAFVWQLLPTWMPLTAAGILVLGCAITYERRRRDLARLRNAIGRMT